ncbi:MAG: plastocyanin/azurin family copper-binding protein [Actinomycetota bacterium]|nr:plastocyanin/azurin family copper-binding protein [Actinomycetota bacterium]
MALFAALAVSMAPPAAAASDERPGALALVQAKITGYATPVIVAERGEEITFTNLDLEKHNVVQDVAIDGKGSKKRMPWCEKPKSDGHEHHDTECPIFWSKLIGLAETTPILGLDNVKSGEIYSFFCTLHHGMKGKLIVR